MRASDVFKEWLVVCDPCHKKLKVLAWASKFPIICEFCGASTRTYHEDQGQAPGIAPDSIDVEIRHLFSTPRRFTSKTDIKRACNELGVVWNGDTPREYSVRWSGKRKEPEPVKPLIKPAS